MLVIRLILTVTSVRTRITVSIYLRKKTRTKMSGVLQRYAVGKDFTEADYHKWINQLVWWITDRFPKIKNPRIHAEKVIKAACNGTKLDGSQWATVPDD